MERYIAPVIHGEKRWEIQFQTRKRHLCSWSLTPLQSRNNFRERWSLDTYGTRFEKWYKPPEHGFYVRIQYTFNPAKSKYKGGSAGQSSPVGTGPVAVI